MQAALLRYAGEVSLCSDVPSIYGPGGFTMLQQSDDGSHLRTYLLQTSTNACDYHARLGNDKSHQHHGTKVDSSATGSYIDVPSHGSSELTRRQERVSLCLLLLIMATVFGSLAFYIKTFLETRITSSSSSSTGKSKQSQ